MLTSDYVPNQAQYDSSYLVSDGQSLWVRNELSLIFKVLVWLTVLGIQFGGLQLGHNLKLPGIERGAAGRNIEFGNLQSLALGDA